MIIFDIIGIIGVALILTAFILLEKGTIGSHSKKYLFMNMFGSVGIIISLYKDWNLPSFIINSCWILISLYGLYKAKKL